MTLDRACELLAERRNAEPSTRPRGAKKVATKKTAKAAKKPAKKTAKTTTTTTTPRAAAKSTAAAKRAALAQGAEDQRGPPQDGSRRGRRVRPSGVFLVFEGIDVSGKSTQARRVAQRHDALFTFEPGDTALGAELRKLGPRRRDPDGSGDGGTRHARRPRAPRAQRDRARPRGGSRRRERSLLRLDPRVPGVRPWCRPRPVARGQRPRDRVVPARRARSSSTHAGRRRRAARATMPGTASRPRTSSSTGRVREGYLALADESDWCVVRRTARARGRRPGGRRGGRRT